jgi:phenylalanyl-tRNA synthetase alpha chain
MSEKNTEKNNTEQGHIHPITRVMDEITMTFADLGFEVVTCNESDDEYHNFDALNVPADHPARDMQDTFWLKDFPKNLMRTQTSNSQIHFMENHKPPFKITAPGKVYRYEATDKTHEVQFHQVEGLVVGEGISMANLKFTLNSFIKKMFGEDVEIRFRPGYFPFVEPGVEIDMKKKDGSWVEVLGAGMVNKAVLNNVGIDTNKYQGFAFGVGVDRIAMLKYGVDDLRNFYNGDLRLINQF